MSKKTKGTFPYTLGLDEHEPSEVYSVAFVKRAGIQSRSVRGSLNLFTVVNGAMSYSSRTDDASLFVKHPWARDDEADLSYIAKFDLASVALSSTYEDFAIYTAWLVEARFYPEESPFPEVRTEPLMNSKGHYSNVDNPYMPSAVYFDNLVLPLQVEITISQRRSVDEFNEYLEQFYVAKEKSEDEASLSS